MGKRSMPEIGIRAESSATNAPGGVILKNHGPSRADHRITSKESSVDRTKVNHDEAGKINRRTALKLAGGAGAFSLARGATVPATAAQSTPVASPELSYPVLYEEGPITIYDYGMELPTDDVTFRYADHQGVRVPFHEAHHAAFTEAHPNITVEYDSLGADLSELLVIGVQSGDAHDIMPANAGFPVPQGVAEGWLAPLDDVVPDFEQWKAAFPENTFLPGINVFDGKTYTCPMYASKLHRQLLYYSVPLLEQAGYDPGSKPLTWDEFRDAAKTVSEQGGGDTFGIIIDQGGFGLFVRTLAERAGAHGGEFNWVTGDYNYTSEEFLGAIELLLAIKEDGGILPGTASLTGTDVRSRFPQGVGAMWLSGIWNVSIWEQGNPDFDFGVASAPNPNGGTPFPFSIEPGVGESYVLYSGSEYKEIAGALLAFIGSLEGNVALKEISHAVNPVAFTRADEIVELSPIGTKALELNDKQLVYQPHPAVRNVETTRVEMELRPVTPGFNDVVVGLFTGQLSDPKAAMQDLQDRSNAELDRAIKAAQEEGAQVSRDDWVFPDWDPMTDYGLEDYK